MLSAAVSQVVYGGVLLPLWLTYRTVAFAVKNPPGADKSRIKNEKMNRRVLLDLNLFLTIIIVLLKFSCKIRKMLMSLGRNCYLLAIGLILIGGK